MDRVDIADDTDALLVASEQVLSRRLAWPVPMSERNMAVLRASAGHRDSCVLLLGCGAAAAVDDEAVVVVVARAHTARRPILAGRAEGAIPSEAERRRREFGGELDLDAGYWSGLA